MIIKKNNTYFILLFIVCSSILLASCASEYSEGHNENALNSEIIIPAVEVVKARYGSLPLSERLSGTVEAENQVALYPEISAPVEEIYVQNGDEVSRGAPLVKLQDDQYREQYQQAQAGYKISQAQLQQARAQLAPLESQLERIQALRDKNLSSEQMLESIQSEVKLARAEVELAEAQASQAQALMQQQQNLLSKTIIRAPVSGTVGQRNAEIGMQASPNTPLFVIGDLTNMVIEVVLTADMLSYVEVGQTARIYVNADSIQYIEGKVAHISPFLNDVTRSTEAEITVTNKNQLLKSGMFVPVDILYGDSRNATLLPSSAIYTDPQTGEVGVYVAPSLGVEVEIADTSNTETGSAALTSPTPVEFKPVEIVGRGAMSVGVSNVDAGQWVVTVGQHLLSEGRGTARVRVTSWERVLMLQNLQQEDLLRKVLEEQSRQQNG